MKKKTKKTPHQRDVDTSDPLVTVSFQFSPRRLANAIASPEATPAIMMLATLLTEELGARVASTRTRTPTPKPKPKPKTKDQPN
jgi:hypothetical protein